jgi:hypothetical protein
MTIKLLLLKSGEDVIADVQEMVIGEEENQRVIGYFLNKPCVVKMVSPKVLSDDSTIGENRAGYSVTLFPWMPLAKESRIPLTTEWVVTMVEPTDKLKEMYITDVINYGKDEQSSVSDEQSDSDNSD